MEITELEKEATSLGDIGIYTCARHSAVLLRLSRGENIVYENWHDLPGLEPPYKKMYTSLASYARMNNILPGETDGQIIKKEIEHCKGPGPSACGHCCLCHSSTYGPRILSDNQPDETKGWKEVRYKDN